MKVANLVILVYLILESEEIITEELIN